MNRYTVVRFDAREQPIATADFATRDEADNCYSDFVKSLEKDGGVQMVSPRGFILKRFVYGDHV